MIPALKKDPPAAAKGPAPAALVARVAAASSEYLDADPREREAAAVRSAELFDQVFDACRSYDALEELDRGASAGFSAWIPDTAFDLASFGREREAVALLERLAERGWMPKLPRLGRNSACLCGSGRKFKRCCGRKGSS